MRMRNDKRDIVQKKKRNVQAVNILEDFSRGCDY